MSLHVQLTTEQQYRVVASPTTASGNPASLDGPLRAIVTSGEGDVLPGNTDLEVILRTSDNPGPATFLIEADADLGEGVVLIQDTVTFDVQGAMASNLGLSGSVEPKGA